MLDDDNSARHATRFGEKVWRFSQAIFKSFLIGLASRSHEKIELAKRLYVLVPKAEVTLISVGAGGSEVIQSMCLPVNDAAQIFSSMKRACDLQEIVEVKVGDLSWTTDGRIRPSRDNIIIAFNGPEGRSHTITTRKDVETAVEEFASRFGLK